MACFNSFSQQNLMILSIFYYFNTFLWFAVNILIHLFKYFVFFKNIYNYYKCFSIICNNFLCTFNYNIFVVCNEYFNCF